MTSRHNVVFASLLAFGLFAAPGPPGAKPVVEWRIGEIDSSSGVMAAQGTAVHEGVVYAVSEINARGGILGSPVKLVTRDDGSRPDEGRQARPTIWPSGSGSAPWWGATWTASSARWRRWQSGSASPMSRVLRSISG